MKLILNKHFIVYATFGRSGIKIVMVGCNSKKCRKNLSLVRDNPG